MRNRSSLFSSQSKMKATPSHFISTRLAARLVVRCSCSVACRLGISGALTHYRKSNGYNWTPPPPQTGAFRCSRVVFADGARAVFVRYLGMFGNMFVNCG